MVGAVGGGDEAEPVAGAADAEAERRIRRHPRRDARWRAALERNADEMAELVAAGVVVIVDEAPIRTEGAGDRASRAVRQSPQPSGRHVPRVEPEGAGHVGGE